MSNVERARAFVAEAMVENGLVPSEPSEKMIRAWVQWGWAAFLSASPEVP
ncbi:hypothetical protein ACYPJF_07590 [Stenotrophomonas geniculata]